MGVAKNEEKKKVLSVDLVLFLPGFIYALIFIISFLQLTFGLLLCSFATSFCFTFRLFEIFLL